MLRGECHEAEASEASLTMHAAVSGYCHGQHPGFTARLQQAPLPLDPGCFSSPSRHGFRLSFGFCFRIYFYYYRGKNASVLGEEVISGRENVISSNGKKSSGDKEEFIRENIISGEAFLFLLRHTIYDKQEMRPHDLSETPKPIPRSQTCQVHLDHKSLSSFTEGTLGVQHTFMALQGTPRLEGTTVTMDRR